MPSKRPSLADRYRGALLALACGDAIGASVAFEERDTFPPLDGMVGGGVYRLAPGQWTDDTSLAMCLAESLVECGEFDAFDQMTRYLRWMLHGHWSALPHCFDIGEVTERSLDRFQRTLDPYAGPTAPHTAGNGSLMRLAPVVLRYFPSQHRVLQYCALSSRTTHGAPQAVDGCRLLGYVLHRLLEGCAKEDALSGAVHAVSHHELADVAEGSHRAKSRQQIESSGYAVASLEAALWCFETTNSLPEALLCAANLGHDADTVAAITGQLAGAHYGAQAIPRPWLQRLHRGDDIAALADALFRIRGLVSDEAAMAPALIIGFSGRPVPGSRLIELNASPVGSTPIAWRDAPTS